MKKILALILVGIMSLTFVACGGQEVTVTEGTTTVTEGKEAETGASNFETVAVGNKIATDFVELTITEAEITNSVKTKIKTGNVTRTFGPDDSAETDFAVVRGTIMNKATSTLSDEIVANAKVGDYTLEEDGVYIYKSDGDTTWELSPLVEYNFMMYVEIPNALVEGMESCDFNFGFNTNLEDAFVKLGEADYQYTLKITPEVAAPAEEAVE